MFDDIARMIDEQMKELEKECNIEEKEDNKLDGMKEDIKRQLRDWYMSVDTRKEKYSLRSFIIGYLGSLRFEVDDKDTKQKVIVKIMKVGK